MHGCDEAMQMKNIGAAKGSVFTQALGSREEIPVRDEGKAMEAKEVPKIIERQQDREKKMKGGDQGSEFFEGNVLQQGDPSRAGGIERSGPRKLGPDGAKGIGEIGLMMNEAQYVCAPENIEWPMQAEERQERPIEPTLVTQERPIEPTIVTRLIEPNTGNVNEIEVLGVGEGGTYETLSVKRGEEREIDVRDVGGVHELCELRRPSNIVSEDGTESNNLGESLYKDNITNSNAVEVSLESIKPRYNWCKGIKINGAVGNLKGVQGRKAREAERRKKLRKKQQVCNQSINSESISCSPVNIGNRFLCLRNSRKEAKCLWLIGKELGLKSKDNEEAVIRKLEELEERDRQENQKEKIKGTKGGL